MQENNLDYIREKLKDEFDVKYRKIINKNETIWAVFIDNMCNGNFISEYIFNPLMNSNDDINIDTTKSKILSANSVGDVSSKEEALLHILSGDVVLLFESNQNMLYCEAKGFQRRGITIPITENVLKGPREGFTEAFVDNISLLRRKIKNYDLKFESFYVGNKSNTVVVMAYINNIAPPKLVNYIKNQINNIDTEFVLDCNYIEEKIREKKTAFDTVGHSEKPDIIASKILEGRVAVIVDGTPFVMIAPYFFIENFQGGDDYYTNKYIGNFSRILRWISFFIAIFLPGIYVAITTYHFTLIPSVFVFRLAISRAGVPFPTVVEVLLMLFFFCILREAGIRLPQPVGQAVSIVGALILGDAAVGAGLASQSTMIIVALSSISSFLIPKLFGAIVLWTIIIIIFSSVLGLPGFYISFFIFLAHLASLNSCGYPYLYPLGTLNKLKFKDITIRDDLNKISNVILDKDENT